MAFRSCFGVLLLVRCVDCYATTTITRTRARNISTNSKNDINNKISIIAATTSAATTKQKQQ